MLTPPELRASRTFIERVLRFVPADLVQASLFGSRARGDGRPESDVDILLVFRRLAPDREPHATMAEDVADQVAKETGVPVTVWSVALIDLQHGNRTPMLVDALEDAVPLWCAGTPLPTVAFTPDDALRCVDSLQQRIREGAREFREHLDHGRADDAFRRARDDVIRGCTAVLLTRGITRPRRGEAADRYVEMMPATRGSAELGAVLEWAARSYGSDGRDEDAPVRPPPAGIPAVSRAIDHLRQQAAAGARRLIGAASGYSRRRPGTGFTE